MTGFGWKTPTRRQPPNLVLPRRARPAHTMSTSIEIIAEIANAHQGDPDAAARLGHAALEAGADSVKFQVYSAEELLVRSHPRFDHFRRQAFGIDAWADLLREFVTLDARVYCDVFGLESLGVAREAAIRGIKVHSSDLGNDHLLRAVSEGDERVLLGVGGSTFREIRHAVNLVADNRRPVMLHGFQSYPTAVEDASLDRIRWLASLFSDSCDIGYMDHLDADDPFALILPLLALGFGATVLEKHVTLNRQARGTDYYSSLNPDEFARFVEAVRRAESAISNRPGGFSPAEREYRRTVKKHWVAARPLAAGHLLEPHDLVMKRVPDQHAEAVPIDMLAGRALRRDVAEEQPLTRAHVVQTVWATVVARAAASRLPEKGLLDVGGQPALAHLFERLKQATAIDRIVLCTTTQSEDDRLEALAREADIGVHRGAVDDVLGRMLGALEGAEVDIVVRVTGDDILVDPDYVDRAIGHHLASNAEYTDLKALPSGTEVEIFDTALLRDIWRTAVDRGGTEYLTTYVSDNRDQIRTTSCPVDPGDAGDWRLTLDTREDYAVIRAVLEAMAERGKPLDYRVPDIIAFIRDHPEVTSINASVRQRQTPPDVRTALDWSRVA